MNDKETEKKLKQSAKKIELKNFDERWEAVQERVVDIKKEESTVAIPVLATAEEEISHKSRFRNPWILAVLLAVCALTLAIVLPLALRQRKLTSYFYKGELQVYVPVEGEFSQRLAERKISIFEFDLEKADVCTLFVTPKNVVRGGTIEYDRAEEEGYFFHVQFYDEYIQGVEKISEDCETWRLNNIVINYRTVMDEDVYSTVATMNLNKVNYYMEILSVEDNIETIFDLFYNKS